MRILAPRQRRSDLRGAMKAQALCIGHSLTSTLRTIAIAVGDSNDTLTYNGPLFFIKTTS